MMACLVSVGICTSFDVVLENYFTIRAQII
jgi:hypothetical protein